jgi:hypothetical protein
VDATRTDASDDRAPRHGKKGPEDPPERLAGDDPRQCGLADDLAGDEAGISDHGYRQRDRQHLNAGVGKSGGARQQTGDDHNKGYPSAGGQTAVDDRAHQSAGARGRQQDTVAATAEPKRVRGVCDELHGLGSVREFGHRHDHDQPQRERSRAHRPQPLGQLGNPGRMPTGRSTVGTDCRDQQRRYREGRAIRRKRDPGGGHCEQDRSDRRADDDSESLDRVQERVCRTEQSLTDQAREESHRRRLFRAASGRC